jgi:hypothetical protein
MVQRPRGAPEAAGGQNPGILVRLTRVVRNAGDDMNLLLGTEHAVIERLYRDRPDADFSRDVLARQPEMLAVLPVTGVSWDDLGVPARVLAIR